MNDTPRTDAESYDAIANTNSALLSNDVQEVVPANFARQLEKELSAVKAMLTLFQNQRDMTERW